MNGYSLMNIIFGGTDAGPAGETCGMKNNNVGSVGKTRRKNPLGNNAVPLRWAVCAYTPDGDTRRTPKWTTVVDDSCGRARACVLRPGAAAAARSALGRVPNGNNAGIGQTARTVPSYSFHDENVRLKGTAVAVAIRHGRTRGGVDCRFVIGRGWASVPRSLSLSYRKLYYFTHIYIYIRVNTVLLYHWYGNMVL